MSERESLAALCEAVLAVAGEPVAVVCATNRQGDGSVEFAPFGMLFNGNPYELVNPPDPEGGFFTQGE